MTSRVPLSAGKNYVAVIFAVGLGALVVQGSAVLALIAPALLGVFLLVVLVRVMIRWPDDPLDYHRILRWTIAAFFAHLLFGLIFSTIPNPLNYLRSDAATYHQGATSLLHHWTSGSPAPILPGGKEGFYYVLAGLYWVFGPHRVAGLVLNASLAAALIPLVTSITYRLFGRAAAGYVPPLVLLLPGIFVWTSQLLKEGPVLFLITVAAYCAVRISERVAVGPLVALSTSLAVLFTFRGPVGLVVAGGLIGGVVLASRQLLGGLGTGLSAATLVAVLILTLGVGLSGYETAVKANLTQANIMRQDLATARSGIRPEVDISTPRRALSYLPVGIIDLMLGPFPWQLRSGVQLFAVPDVVVWWALLPSLLGGLRAARSFGRRSLILVLPAAAAVCMLALAVGNFGTIVRERTQVVILLVPFLALGLAVRAAGRQKTIEPAAVASPQG